MAAIEADPADQNKTLLGISHDTQKILTAFHSIRYGVDLRKMEKRQKGLIAAAEKFSLYVGKAGCVCGLACLGELDFVEVADTVELDFEKALTQLQTIENEAAKR